MQDLARKRVLVTGGAGLLGAGAKPDGQPRCRLDSSHAARAFGFRARTSVADGLARPVAWSLAEPAGGA